MDLIEFLKKVPDVVWSGLLASAVTLSGVLLSNWWNTRNLKRQLQHDSEEKARQRKADLRKEVYLNAAEELVKVNAYLPSIPQLDFTRVNASEGMVGFLAAATKLQLVAEEKTSLLVIKLVSDYGDLMLKVISRAMPIQRMQCNITFYTEQYDEVQSEIKRLLTAMSVHVESGQTDQVAFDWLKRAIDFQQSRADELTAARDNLLDKKNAAQIAFSREIFRDIKTLGRTGVHLFIDIRKELDMGTDIDAFMKVSEEQWQKMDARLDATLNELETA